MAKNPSSIWYWNDWIIDPAVRMCSAAAQGMWMQLLAIAASADGYVKIGNKPCSICDLATITGWRKQDISRWVRELEKRGVFSRTDDGTIFCRRMVREAEARAAKRKKASHHRNISELKVAHPPEGITPPESLDNPTPICEKSPPPDSDSVAVSQNPLPTSKPLPLLNAARARAEKDEHNKKENPQEGRSAPLARPGERPPPCAVSQTINISRSCRPPPRQKSPALKTKIRDLLTQKHARFLIARRRPDELAAYWAGMLDPDPKVAQRMLDDTDRRMRCANWDDMRQWKAAAGLPP